ncbi:acyl-CoA dehydrogenase family protein [Streptomyces sp. bgisy153]|uniref:acyl-CoA dehydrogenase family protein n=1 Tax=Streptomyces sp. bgisy153 TaxID=3413793 RepID=UPI003D759F67
MPTTLIPHLTPEQDLLRQEADAFAAEEIAPRVADMEHKPHQVERDIPRLLADRRWFGVTIPEAFGGMDAGHVAKTILIHRLATVSGAAAAILQAGLIPVAALVHFATDEQKAYWLPPAAEGAVLLTIAVTEPETGGHIGGMKTIAERDGDEWVITGSKLHIGNSHIAHLHVVIARTAAEGTKRPTESLTAFLVEHDRKGLTVKPHRAGLGLHGFTRGRLDFAGVRVPDTHRLGEVGQGMAVAKSSSILCGLPNLTAISLGLHETVLLLTTRYLKERPRYGGALFDLPVLRDRLGEMEARFRTAHSLAYQAVGQLDEGLPCDSDLVNAKYMGHELAARSGRDAMELHGARGLDSDYPLERLWRDIQHTYPPAGTGEFQRIRLSQGALGESTPQWSQLLRRADPVRLRADPTPA